MADDLTSDMIANLQSRYQGAASDPDLSFDNPTAYPQASFAPSNQPDLSSRFYDKSGNFQFMAPNPQHPANQPQSQLMQGLSPIQNLQQLGELMKQIKDVPDELKSRILTKVTGVPIDSQKAIQLQNSLLQMEFKRQENLPQQQFQRSMQQQSLDLRKQQLSDMRTYRQGLVDQGTKFSVMMLRQHISDLRDQIKNTLSTDPSYPDMIKEYQESIKDFGNAARGFQQAPNSATRGGVGQGQGQDQSQAQKPTSGAFNIGGKQVTWTRSPDEGQ